MTTPHVSISAYQDPDLLDGALASIRDVLPDAQITVVDGKYSTFKPDAPANSDGLAAVCEDYGATYDAAGPFERERNKHIYRVEQAPTDRLTLLLDADERLFAYDADALEPATAYRPRIANALVYGPKTVYWPRLANPEWVELINRWDAYAFSVPVKCTDAVTIIHRHDLRDREYREAKYDRFEREDRTGRYADANAYDTYLHDDWNTEFTTCPNCGAESVTETQATHYGPLLTRVRTCVAGDRCYSEIVDNTVDEYRYLPEDWQRGLTEDPDRLQRELLTAGCDFVTSHGAAELYQLKPAIAMWIDDVLGDGEAEVFG